MNSSTNCNVCAASICSQIQRNVSTGIRQHITSKHTSSTGSRFYKVGEKNSFRFIPYKVWCWQTKWGHAHNSVNTGSQRARLTICFSVYLLELRRLTASMWPKSMSWPRRKMKRSLHTYFFFWYPSKVLSPATTNAHSQFINTALSALV